MERWWINVVADSMRRLVVRIGQTCTAEACMTASPARSGTKRGRAGLEPRHRTQGAVIRAGIPPIVD
eukprot:scaffold1583_cov105-Isochrysis_galbana.AAC.2